MARKQPQWEAIERAYRAGVLSIKAIADQYDLSDTAIRKKAAKEGWERDLADEVRSEVRRKLVKSVVRENHCEPVELAQIVDEASDIGVRVVVGHRHDLNRANGLVRLLMEDLESVVRNRSEIEGEIRAATAEDEGGMRRASMLAAVALPSNAKTIFQLSGALKNLQTLERQAYSLDDPITKQEAPIGKIEIEVVGAKQVNQTDDD